MEAAVVTSSWRVCQVYYLVSLLSPAIHVFTVVRLAALIPLL